MAMKKKDGDARKKEMKKDFNPKDYHTVARLQFIWNLLIILNSIIK